MPLFDFVPDEGLLGLRGMRQRQKRALQREQNRLNSAKSIGQGIFNKISKGEPISKSELQIGSQVFPELLEVPFTSAAELNMKELGFPNDPNLLFTQQGAFNLINKLSKTDLEKRKLEEEFKNQILLGQGRELENLTKQDKLEQLIKERQEQQKLAAEGKLSTKQKREISEDTLKAILKENFGEIPPETLETITKALTTIEAATFDKQQTPSSIETDDIEISPDIEQNVLDNEEFIKDLKEIKRVTDINQLFDIQKNARALMKSKNKTVRKRAIKALEQVLKRLKELNK